MANFNKRDWDFYNRINQNLTQSFHEDAISRVDITEDLKQAAKPLQNTNGPIRTDSPWVMYFGPVYKHPLKIKMVDLPTFALFVSVQAGIPVYRHPGVGS